MKCDQVLIYTVIVDDQPSSIDALEKALQDYPEIKIIESTTSLEKAKKAIIRHQPALLFLDIEMPGQSGLEFLTEISPYIRSGMCVVFYSAFNKYMIDALRVSAFDYLLKPFQKEELDGIVNRVKDKILTGQANTEQFKFHLAKNDRKFAIHTVTGLLLLNRMEVLYFEYLNKLRSWQLMHTNFSTHRLQLNTTSKDILNMNESFVQVSRDYIINIEYLSAIENKTYRCSLYPPFNKLEIFASRRYFALIKETLDIL